MGSSRARCLRFAAFVIATLCRLIASDAAQAQSQRVALVVGNGAYQHASSLANPPNDATDIEQAFLRIGFDVTHVSNVDRLGFLKSLRAFEDKVASADIAIIFYAGHGIEIEGNNYLIPVDARLERDIDVEDEAVALTRILQTVREAKRLRLVLLDACRANSFENRMKRTFATRTTGRGLNNLQPAGSTVVAYSAKQGTLAEDGSGRNSPFASSLLARLEQPGLEINFLFRAVRDDVLKTTNMRQEPYTYGSLGSEKIYLNGVSEPSTNDEVAWNFLDRTNTRELQRFIRQFPDSKFREAAEVALNSIGPVAEPTSNSTYPVLAAPIASQPENMDDNAASEKKNQFGAVSPSYEQPLQLRLTVALQDELRRVGCNLAAVDGDWTPASQRALELFNKHADTRFDLRSASSEALNAIRRKVGRVCPLVCDFGYRAEGSGCRKIVCGAGYYLSDDGSCKAPREKKATRTPEPTLRPQQPPATKRDAVRPKQEASGKIFCDGQGCRPVAKGCRLESGGWAAGAKNYTSQYQICP